NYLGWQGGPERYDQPLPRPERLDELLSIARQLSDGLDHLRVDLYDLDVAVKVGELTAYRQSGLVPFDPDEADVILGGYWRLPNPIGRALASRLPISRWPVATVRDCPRLFRS